MKAKLLIVLVILISLVTGGAGCRPSTMRAIGKLAVQGSRYLTQSSQSSSSQSSSQNSSTTQYSPSSNTYQPSFGSSNSDYYKEKMNGELRAASEDLGWVDYWKNSNPSRSAWYASLAKAHLSNAESWKSQMNSALVSEGKWAK